MSEEENEEKIEKIKEQLMNITTAAITWAADKEAAVKQEKSKGERI